MIKGISAINKRLYNDLSFTDKINHWSQLSKCLGLHRQHWENIFTRSDFVQSSISYYLLDVLWGPNDQANPSCFCLERCCFYFFCPLRFLQGLRSLKHWLLQKLSMKILDQKFKFLIKKQVLRCPNIFRMWIFWPLQIQL